MQDLMQEVLVVGMDIQTAATGKITSLAAGDYVNMENFQKVTFVLTTGTVTSAGTVSIRKATNKSGSGATAITSAWIDNKYYTATAGTYTANSTVTNGTYIAIGASSDSTTLYATFDATLLSASNQYIGAYQATAGISAVVTGVYILHNGRYQQGATPDPTL